ncbi:MAG: DUF402 domain-containing protein [Clostridiales bacterium]|nr:DUF402 domain-containing protein [Clostridiales bacterium]
MARILRNRYIPLETIDLTADELLYRDENYLITRWTPIKPRKDIASGVSCVFLKKGWKISAFSDDSKKIVYWYCDIIDIEYDKETDTYLLNDLLADIKIMEDGKVQIIDLDELAIAFEEGLITKNQLISSLKKSNELLSLVYRNDVAAMVKEIILKHTGIGV